MALYTAGAGPILTPAEVETLVVSPVMDQAVSSASQHRDHHRDQSLRIPVVTQDPQASFVAEGAEIPVSDGTLTEIEVTPKKLAALSDYQLRAGQRSIARRAAGCRRRHRPRRKAPARHAFLSRARYHPERPKRIGQLTTAVATNGGSWANLDSFEAAKANAETLHYEVTAFVAAPATVLASEHPEGVRDGRVQRAIAPVPIRHSQCRARSPVCRCTAPPSQRTSSGRYQRTRVLRGQAEATVIS